MSKNKKNNTKTPINNTKRRLFADLTYKIIPNDITKIKNKASLYELIDLDNANKLGLLEHFFYQNPLPSSYEELGHVKTHKDVRTSKNLVQEVDWCLFAFKKYTNEIKLFLNYKSKYEKSFLLGNYNDADKYLTQIENEICYSLWSLENRFLLLEYSKGTEANKSFLNDLNKKKKEFNENINLDLKNKIENEVDKKLKEKYEKEYENKINQNSVNSALANYFSQKVESNLTVNQYNNDLSKALKQAKEYKGKDKKYKYKKQAKKEQGNFPKEWEEYYYFKLNFWEGDYTELQKILGIESHNSIIDRYLSVLKILKLVFSNVKESNFILLKHWTDRLDFLYKQTKDENILHLLSILDLGTFEKYGKKNYDYKALDTYTQELYQEARSKLLNTIEIQPNNFDYYIPYLNSYIYDKIEYIGEQKDSPKNKILNELHDALNRKKEPRISSINIERLSKNLSSFDIADELNIFNNADKYQKENKWQFYYGAFTKKYGSVFAAKYIIFKKFGLQYLQKLNIIVTSSTALDFEIGKLTGYDAVENFIGNFKNSVIKQTALAENLQSEKQYLDAKIEWVSIFENSKGILPIQENALKNVFYCHVQLNELDLAIRSYVDILIINPKMLSKVDVSEIHRQIDKSKFRTIEKNINLPLFYNNSSTDENTIQYTSELFLTTLNAKVPSEVNWVNTNIDKNKIMHYLYNVCRPDILQESDYINGTQECYNERIKICRILQEIDDTEDGKKHLENEIERCLTYLTTLEGLEQINSGKIYIDEYGLINELAEFEGLYSRYQALAKTSQKNNGNVFYLNQKSAFQTGVSQTYSKQPLLDAFENIFEEVLERFLYSTSGISAYLSTRIRHGAIVGGIRPIFDRAGLVSQKKAGTDLYQDIKQWNIPIINTDNQQKLQSNLKNLSEEVDELIREIKEENIQIKTSDTNIKGWFNYDFSYDDIFSYSLRLRDVNNYRDFISALIHILWIRTDENLEDIRYNLENQVRQDFENILQKTTENCELVIPRNQLPELYTNITTCSTDIQRALVNISKWFQKTGSEVADFSINKLLGVIEADVSRRYVHKSMNLEKIVSTNCEIKGEFYQHFVDLFGIFINNAIEHAIENHNTIPICVNISQEDDILKVIIINEYPNISDLNELLSNGINKIKDEKRVINERKSGLPKADKILKRDLKNNTNDFDIKIVDGNKCCVSMKINLEKLTV